MVKIDTSHIFPFVLTLFLTILLITTWDILKPSAVLPHYNFAPFPTVVPANVPPVNPGMRNRCRANLVPPENDSCEMCGPDFVPTPVLPHENVMYNDKPVPAGTWCLPKGKSELGCGLYTGRAVWSDRSGKQQWSCVCLYPNLFGGDSCQTQLACRDLSQPGDQSKNVLKSKDGHIWDPNSPNFNPLGRTPYDTDEKGEPLYTCDCAQGADNLNVLKYTQLPNDPYRCHAEPCTVKHLQKGFDPKTNSCACSSIQKNTYAHSNVTGKCYLATQACGDKGGWNDDTNMCNCASEDQISVTCRSKFMTRDKYDQVPCADGTACSCDGDPHKTCDRQCPENPAGSECVSPCDPSPCDPVGTVKCTADKKNNSFLCHCGENSTSKFSGRRCEKSCFKKHVEVPGKSPGYCCSGSVYYDGDCPQGGGACIDHWKCN